MAVLNKGQKHHIVSCPWHARILVATIDVVAGYNIAFDGLETSTDSLAIDPGKGLLPKRQRALAIVEYTTPSTEALDVDGQTVAAKGCCDVCRQGHSNRQVLVMYAASSSLRPRDSGSQRHSWLEDQESQVVSPVGKGIPFW